MWENVPPLDVSTAALPGQTTKTTLIEEFMFQNVAYRSTVYITGVKLNKLPRALFRYVHTSGEFYFYFILGLMI